MTQRTLSIDGSWREMAQGSAGGNRSSKNLVIMQEGKRDAGPKGFIKKKKKREKREGHCKKGGGCENCRGLNKESTQGGGPSTDQTLKKGGSGLESALCVLEDVSKRLPPGNWRVRAKGIQKGNFPGREKQKSSRHFLRKDRKTADRLRSFHLSRTRVDPGRKGNARHYGKTAGDMADEMPRLKGWWRNTLEGARLELQENKGGETEKWRKLGRSERKKKRKLD